MMQSTRMPIATEYLIMRRRRSSSGESGRFVIDCCFMSVTGAANRARSVPSSLRPTQTINWYAFDVRHTAWTQERTNG